MSKKKFEFSIIVPIYNVEEYLEETIESVINQTIGFEENVQLILVNDGSPDNSESICLEYKEKYPDNIVYIKQKNGGVSSARNNGMKYIEGEYVNFLDSDDLWQLDALEKANEFFNIHNDVDVIATPMEFFGSKSGMSHPLNWKFDCNQVIDLTLNPSYVQLSNSSCFIRSNVIEEGFDENLKYGEDSLFINKIILKKMKYGLLSSVHYMYRKRLDGTSAMDKNISSPEYYSNTIEKFHFNLFNYSKKSQSTTNPPLYIQYVIMYDLQWRLKAKMPKTALTSKELIVYRDQIAELLKEIDESVILDQRNLPNEYKILAFRLKNKHMISKLLYKNGSFYLNDEVAYQIPNTTLLKITFLNIRDHNLEIAAMLNCPLDEKDIKVYYVYNGKKKHIKIDEKFEADNRYVLDQYIYKTKYFNLKEKLEDNRENSIAFYLKYKENDPIKLLLNFSVNGKLSRDMSLHFVKNNYMIIQKNESIIAEPYNLFKAISLEFKLFVQFCFKGYYKQIIYRLASNISRIVKKKELWLISDRISIANDNGFHLFRYICDQDKIKDKEIYFVIKKDCEDYHKMKQYGKVLAYNSFRYKIKFLIADKIISSQADEFLTNAFGKNNRYYRDLYRFDFIFLQHGIIKDDLSTWLNIYHKNIRMFVTSVVGEFESVINGKYGFKKDVVKLTGLPRYDNLVDDNQKLIAFMPTWRKDIATQPNRETGIRNYSSEFKYSEYFKFYNKLINDKRILSTMKKKGYRGLFVVHPSHVANSIDFQKNDYVQVIDGFADYQEIFKKSSLLISDYSSVPFDFAYLYKPVIYTQFDKEKFFKSHLYQEGYFKYEKDGLGPVCYDYENTVKTIIDYINNDCQLESKYKQRIDKFYKYHDKNNCKRVLDEIKKI